MSIAKCSSIPEVMKKNMVMVHSYDNKVMSGVLSNQWLENQVAFHSFSEFVLMYDMWMSKIHYPEEGDRKRSLYHKDTLPYVYKMQSEELQNNRGAIATFLIHVYYRQHSSWQGKIYWIEQKKEQYFRSVLELLYLMDEILITSNTKINDE